MVSLWETRNALKPTFSSFQDASGQLMKGHAPVQALCDARRKGACNGGTLSTPRNRRIRGVLGRSDALLARIWYAIQTRACTGSERLQAAYGRRSWRRLDGCRKGGMSALQRHIESIAKPAHPRRLVWGMRKNGASFVQTRTPSPNASLRRFRMLAGSIWKGRLQRKGKCLRANP